MSTGETEAVAPNKNENMGGLYPNAHVLGPFAKMSTTPVTKKLQRGQKTVKIVFDIT